MLETVALRVRARARRRYRCELGTLEVSAFQSPRWWWSVRDLEHGTVCEWGVALTRRGAMRAARRAARAQRR
ncbi:hypothetical protein [Paraconexibacter sp.]|uniref:hypothetical protein n=1 Tax=Paraconexibacter sp. TaxID=2949640 RepID=UPI003568ABF7